MTDLGGERCRKGQSRTRLREWGYGKGRHRESLSSRRLQESELLGTGEKLEAGEHRGLKPGDLVWTSRMIGEHVAAQNACILDK